MSDIDKNLRIVADNQADNLSSIACAQDNVQFPATNLNKKHKTWRTTALTCTIVVNFYEPTPVSMVAFALCNFSADAKISISGYDGLNNLLFSNPSEYCCARKNMGSFYWGVDPLGDGKKGQGRGDYATTWFDIKTVSKLLITVLDTHNPLPFLEAENLIIGYHWSPSFNPDYGEQVSIRSTTESGRTRAGATVTDKGIKYKEIKMNLSLMADSDSQTLLEILSDSSSSQPVFMSLFPNGTDASAEHKHQIFGYTNTDNIQTLTHLRRSKSRVNITEI